jgi:DNA-binding MarR family transcriptional regulator
MSEDEHDLRILEALAENPEVTQAGLATRLGVAVGSVNWYLKRLIRKGYIKVTHLQRRRLKYLVTPKGLARKGHLALQYMEASLRVYRELRQAARETLGRLREAGYPAVKMLGGGEAAEIFCLSCLEAGVQVEDDAAGALPAVRVEGTQFVLEWPAGAANSPEGKERVDG